MSLLQTLQSLRTEAQTALKGAVNHDALEQARLKYLGRSGALNDIMGRIKEVAKEEKAIFGKTMNEVKKELEELLEAQKQAVCGNAKASGPQPDPTLPGLFRAPGQEPGTIHPLVQARERVCAIFERMGFSVVDGPEIEDDFHNFEALNIPADHPARDDAETFGLSIGGLLRSQTSSVQIRTMEKSRPPLRVLSPGRVYRPDAVDATHHYAFHQIEGLAVDEGITFADLKGCLHLFAQEMFGEETKIRMRPSFFPFTEPSAEVDVTCIFCHGKGCRVCKQSGWIEIMGCGMVDPNVFDQLNRQLGEVRYNTGTISGFAFGMGIERVTMLTTGVDDIRRFQECDLRFLRQFV